MNIQEGTLQRMCVLTVGVPAVDTVLDVSVTYSTAGAQGEAYVPMYGHCGTLRFMWELLSPGHSLRDQLSVKKLVHFCF